ncbi:Nramp family divalent metal transporter [Pseudonocardia nigra]|uniref:Nramp family divalent metal transporter n=1 Tax=Pseudonocardia nigra TaxID=1921578 RepID=UPI001C5E45AB|nr:Nramp family divalent metal transporter [Pseudonocardia nigra]
MAKPAETGTTEFLTYPEPPPKLRRRLTLVTALSVLGPGAIVASANIGSGEMVFASRGGALFGYALLWAFLVSAAAKAALAYSFNRYTVVAGEHPMARWTTLFRGPRGWFPLLMGAVSIAAIPSWVGGLGVGLGDLMASITAVGTGAAWATALIVLSGLLAWFGGYQRLEKAQTVVVGFMLIAIAISVVVLQPDWLAALGGLLPGVPEYHGWVAGAYPEIAQRSVWLELAVYLGAIGGGTYDYIGYAGMLREKKWGLLGRPDQAGMAERLAALPRGSRLPLAEDAEQVARARAWSRAPLGDTVLSFAAIVVFASMFMINGAALLAEEQIVPAGNDTLTFQAQFLTAVHPTLEYLYYVAVFFAFFGSLYAFWELYTYTAYETLSPVFARVRGAGPRGTRPWMYLYILVASLALVWTVGELVVIVTPASVLGGLLTSGLFCLAIVWTEHKVLPPAYRLSRAGRWWVVLSGILLTVLGVVSTWQLFA